MCEDQSLDLAINPLHEQNRFSETKLISVGR